MKYSLFACIILFSIVANANTMEKKSKPGFHIKIRSLSQGSSTLDQPKESPHKKSSPTTEKALEEARKRDAIPRKFSNPKITHNTRSSSSSSSQEEK